MHQTEYSQLIQKLHNVAASEGNPVNGTFELTNRCNLRCNMCYIRELSSEAKINNELSPNEWIDIAKQAKDAGTLFLLLTGGEIFDRKDFFDIYYPIVKMGFLLTLFTNGTLITEDIAKKLAQSPPHRVEITLYGATEKTYESITNIPNSYTKCCKGIEHLIQNRIPLSLKTAITKFNIDELESMKIMAKNWGLKFTAGWLITKRRDFEENYVNEIRITPQQCIELELKDPTLQDDILKNKDTNNDSSNPSNFFCHAGKAVYVVNSFGEMNVCVDLPLPRICVLQSGFSEAWAKVKLFAKNNSELSNECLDCTVYPFCSRCPAWSYLETQNLFNPVSYLCILAQMRKKHYNAE